MSFSLTTIRVNDLDRSVEFYEMVADLEVKSRFKFGENVEIAYLGSDDSAEAHSEKFEPQLELIVDKSLDEIKHSSNILPGFEAGSLEDKLNSLQEGGIEIVDGPHDGKHFRFFIIEGPDGELVHFVEELD